MNPKGKYRNKKSTSGVVEVAAPELCGSESSFFFGCWSVVSPPNHASAARWQARWSPRFHVDGPGLAARVADPIKGWSLDLRRLGAVVRAPRRCQSPITNLRTVLTPSQSAQLDFGLEEHMPISAIGARAHLIGLVLFVFRGV